MRVFYDRMHKLMDIHKIDNPSFNIGMELAFAEMRQGLGNADAKEEALFIHMLALQEEAHKAEMKELRDKYEKIIREKDSLIKALSEDKADLNKQIEVLSSQLANHEKKRDESRPYNYRFPTVIIETALLSIIYAKCSLRGARKIVEIFQEMQPGKKEDKLVPSHVSIGEWAHKAGYDVQQYNDKTELIKEGYHIIVDQSVSVGSQQLLLILAVPDKRDWDHALTPKDVAIAYMKSAAHWKAADVAEAVRQVKEKYGRKPSYCVSDGASNLKGAMDADDLKIPQHIDIGHKFASIFKSVYGGCEDFKKWCKACGDTRRFYLSELGYIMAPGIRSKARFMNVFIPALWSLRIIKNFRSFDRLEILGYEPILKAASLVIEIMEIQSAYNLIFKLVKIKGLCEETFLECKRILNRWIYSGVERQRESGDLIYKYLVEEMRIIIAERDDRLKAGEEDVKVVHDISSDVIESMFGTMKRMMPDCKFFGITKNVLPLNLFTVIAKPSGIHSLHVEERLERTHFKDLFKWEGEFLCESLLAKRKAKLKMEKFTILEIA